MKKDNEYLISVYKKGIDIAKRRNECFEKAVDIKMSRGNKSNAFYGIFPPHENIYILLANKNHGHLTKLEKNIDRKYYFDSDGKQIMQETYWKNSVTECKFFDYGEKSVDIIFCSMLRNEISAVAKCEFSDDGRLKYYMYGTCGFEKLGYYPIHYHAYLYEYDGDDTYVDYILCNTQKKGAPYETSITRYQHTEGQLYEIFRKKMLLTE